MLGMFGATGVESTGTASSRTCFVSFAGLVACPPAAAAISAVLRLAGCWAVLVSWRSFCRSVIVLPLSHGFRGDPRRAPDNEQSPASDLRCLLAHARLRARSHGRRGSFPPRSDDRLTHRLRAVRNRRLGSRARA